LSDLTNIGPSLKDQNDAVLLANLHQEGIVRQRAERELYDRFRYLVKVGERQYRLDEETASSAYSDTIISLIHNIVSNRFESRSSLKSYVHQIFMNKCVDAVRKKTTKKSSVDYNTEEIYELVNMLPDKARTAVQQMIHTHDQDRLFQLVGELGDKCKQLLRLFEDGYEDKEIAAEMNYNSADVVKTTRLRCLEKLREKYFGKESK
jgi:RNA polymerase sigma factor (sigma-70 family)